MKPQEPSIFDPELKSPLPLPLFASPISAGFPAFADHLLEQSLDLNQYLIRHPAATFFVRVDGDSMIGAGIRKEDILIVDRSLEPANGKIVIAVVNGEFTVKRIRKDGQKVVLEAENPRYPSLEIDPSWDFQVWGVVTYVIHKAV